MNVFSILTILVFYNMGKPMEINRMFNTSVYSVMQFQKRKVYFNTCSILYCNLASV